MTDSAIIATSVAGILATVAGAAVWSQIATLRATVSAINATMVAIGERLGAIDAELAVRQKRDFDLAGEIQALIGQLHARDLNATEHAGGVLMIKRDIDSVADRVRAHDEVLTRAFKALGGPEGTAKMMEGLMARVAALEQRKDVSA